MTRKPRRKRRRKHDPDAPLTAAGTVPWMVDEPPRRRPWTRLLCKLVEALPVHRETRRGREFSVMVRLVVGLAAIMLVTKGRQHWGWGAAGVAAALVTLVVPLGETRRRRWLRQLNARLAPRRVLRARDAQLDFDGRKASIRVDGKVWRSQRPFDPPGSTRLLHIDDTLWLGLVPAEGRKRPTLWFCTAAAPHLDRVGDVEVVDEAPDTGMSLDSDGFVAVHEAFVARL